MYQKNVYRPQGEGVLDRVYIYILKDIFKCRFLLFRIRREHNISRPC